MLEICAIILDYYGGTKTVRCLQSLESEALDSVVVIDNSGSLAGASQLKSSLDCYQQNRTKFQLHLLAAGSNLGFAGGINHAIKWLEQHSPHNYYLILNNDAYIEPGAIDKLQAHLHQHPNAALAAPIIEVHSSYQKGAWYHRFLGLVQHQQSLGSFQYLSGCCLLINRKWVQDNLFDEAFFMYGEDVELSWRFRHMGAKLEVVADAIVQHEGTGSSQQGKLFYEYHVARGHMLLAIKMANSFIEIPLMLGTRAVMLSARAIIRSWRYRSLWPLAAFFLAWFNLPVRPNR